MSILITLLTTVLVLNCFFLVLLILIQLPKKESGSGWHRRRRARHGAWCRGGQRPHPFHQIFRSSLILCLVLAVIGNNGNKSAPESGLSEAPKAANLEVTKPPTARDFGPSRYRGSGNTGKHGQHRNPDWHRDHTAIGRSHHRDSETPVQPAEGEEEVTGGRP